MDTNVVWFILLLLIAAVLLAAELVIPSHGVLTVMAGVAMLFMVGVAFSIGRWFGFGALLTLAVLGPIGASLLLKAWQRSRMGRRLVLHTVVQNPPRPAVLVGASGVVMSEIRPMGDCEFGDIRLRARSEMGDVIAAGQSVIAIAVADGVATVRPVSAAAAAHA